MSDFVEKWRLAAQDWRDKKNAAVVLRDNKSRTFAVLYKDTPGSTKAEREQAVLASDEWGEYLARIHLAENAERIAKLTMDYRKMQWEDWRTEVANARTERKMY